MRPNPHLWIWSHLLKKSFMENFIFCAVHELNLSQISTINLPLVTKPLFHPVHQNLNKDILSNWNTILPEAAMGSVFLKNVFRKSFKLNLKKDFNIVWFMKFTKFLRTPILKNNCKRMLLYCEPWIVILVSLHQLLLYKSQKVCSLLFMTGIKDLFMKFNFSLNISEGWEKSIYIEKKLKLNWIL